MTTGRYTVKTIIKRDKRTLAQKIFSRENFQRLHALLGFGLLGWIFWQVFGRLADLIPVTQWEMDNIWSATALFAIRMFLAVALASTSSAVRIWWNDFSSFLNQMVFGTDKTP